MLSKLVVWLANTALLALLIAGLVGVATLARNVGINAAIFGAACLCPISFAGFFMGQMPGGSWWRKPLLYFSIIYIVFFFAAITHSALHIPRITWVMFALATTLIGVNVFDAGRFPSRWIYLPMIALAIALRLIL